MPMKYGHYISKRRMKKDAETLEQLNLSDDRIEAIQDYLYKKLAKQEFLTVVIVVMGIIAVSATPLVFEIMNVLRGFEQIN